MGRGASRAPAMLAIAIWFLVLTAALAAKDPCAAGLTYSDHSLNTNVGDFYIFLHQYDEFAAGRPFADLSVYQYPDFTIYGSFSGPATCFSGPTAHPTAQPLAVSCSVAGSFTAPGYEGQATYTISASGRGVKSSSFMNVYKYTDLAATPSTTTGTNTKGEGFSCSKPSCVLKLTISKPGYPDDIFSTTDFVYGGGTERSRNC